MIRTCWSFGSVRLTSVSVAHAPRNEHPGGLAKCFLSLTIVFSASLPCVCILNEMLFISLESLCLVLRLIEDAGIFLTNKEFKDGVLEYGFSKFLCQDSVSK